MCLFELLNAYMLKTRAAILLEYEECNYAIGTIDVGIYCSRSSCVRRSNFAHFDVVQLFDCSRGNNYGNHDLQG